MLNLKTSFGNAVSFIKPRIVFCIVLCLAFVLSTLLFLGQVNTFVINYDGTQTTVRTLSADITSALSCADINLDSYKVDSAFKTEKNTVVSLLKTFSVVITSGKKTVTVEASENQTVAKVLTGAGYKIDQFDMIEPAPDSIVTENTYIDYVNVDYISGSYNQTVPCSVETVYSNTLDAGVKKTTAGKDGMEQVNYNQKLVNDELVETKVESKVTLLAAKNAVQTVGTRRPAVTTSSAVSTVSVLNPPNPIALDGSGNPVNYKKHVTVQATAYTYTGHNCATGVAPRPGYIAVNPKVIPYGTKMYIKSSDGRYVYGYAIAADTGGFIYSRPTNVDLFFPSVASSTAFGRRNVEIYILD